MRIGVQQLLSTMVVFLVPAVLCGLISRAISKSRGMDGGFWWGFFLLVIGIIVVAVRPNDKSSAQVTEPIKVNRRTDNHSNSAEIETIKKYKELLDCGIITQEEFDEKKKKLLRL